MVEIIEWLIINSLYLYNIIINVIYVFIVTIIK